VQPESFASWSPHTAREPADFTVRLAAEPDVEACVRLAVAIGAGQAAQWRQTLTRTVRDGERRALFVAEAGGEVVGYGRVVYVAPDAAPAGWYLLGLVVDQAWRRRGIGEALTRTRLAWILERAERALYFTRPANRASQELHRRLGFVKLPGHWVPPGGRPEDAGTQEFYCAHRGATVAGMVFYQLTIDANDPALLARFWARALGFVPEPPAEPKTTWHDHYRARLGERTAYPDRIFDPGGLRPPIWFQAVPETKAGKNRLHLDLYPTARDNALPMQRRIELVDAKVAELVGLGATVIRRDREDDPDDPIYYAVMQDPEGNEFCVS